MAHFDVLIRNGLVVDGSGTAPTLASVGVRRDRIEAVGDLSAATGGTELDAHGLAVAPGFIDTHTHSDLACFLPAGHIDVVTGGLRQGVTTEVCGNCGFSAFPFLASHGEEVEHHIGSLFGSESRRFGSLSEYTKALRAQGLYANLAPLVGHGTLRAGVMGFDNRPPQGGEMRAIVRLLEEALEQGAFGMSSGLIYAPGVYARTEELVSLCRVVSARGRPYATHIRGETDMVADAVSEALLIGQDTGIPVHVSHHKAAGQSNWGRVAETLELMQEAYRQGLDVTLDVYPYTAGSTLLYAILPGWVQEGGLQEMLKRLRDWKVRERLAREFEEGIPGWENMQRAAGWESIVISSCPGEREIEGRSIRELAEEDGKTPTDYVCNLLIKQVGRVVVILHIMSEEDVTEVLLYDHAMIGSDCIPLPGKPHPRGAGTFARILGRYCRDRRLLDLATAVQKMTSLPASRFGLRYRGQLAPGRAADIVVFDPASVIDRATFKSPLLAPAGIHHVFVNGVHAVRAGQLTSAKGGRVLLFAS